MTAPITSEQAAETIWRLATPTGARLERVAQQILDIDGDAAEDAYLAATNVDTAAAHRIADQLEAEQKHGGRLHDLLHFAHPAQVEMDELREIHPRTMRTSRFFIIAGTVMLPVNVIAGLYLGRIGETLMGVAAAAGLIAAGWWLVVLAVGSAGRERQAVASSYMIALEMALVAVATYDKIGTGGYTREHFDTLMGPWSRGVHPIHIG